MHRPTDDISISKGLQIYFWSQKNFKLITTCASVSQVLTFASDHDCPVKYFEDLEQRMTLND